LPLNPTDEEKAAYEQEISERMTLRVGGVPHRDHGIPHGDHDVKRPQMKYPEDFPRYTQMLNSPEVPRPILPKNPTDEEKAAYQQALRDAAIRKFDCFNAMVADVDAYHNRPLEAEPDRGKQERWRPRMHPLPAPPEFEANWNADKGDEAAHAETNEGANEEECQELNEYVSTEARDDAEAELKNRQKESLSRARKIYGRESNIHRHESQCSVCRHPEREAIEQEFVHWLSPRATAEDFEIDFRAIYRHAHACNLFAVRNRNIRFVLSHSLERAEHAVTPTPADLNRMVRTFTRVNDDGQWIEPPAQVIVSSGSRAK
jgi:hypothetical protein